MSDLSYDTAGGGGPDPLLRMLPGDITVAGDVAEDPPRPGDLVYVTTAGLLAKADAHAVDSPIDDALRPLAIGVRGRRPGQLRRTGPVRVNIIGACTPGVPLFLCSTQDDGQAAAAGRARQSPPTITSHAAKVIVGVPLSAAADGVGKVVAALVFVPSEI